MKPIDAVNKVIEVLRDEQVPVEEDAIYAALEKMGIPFDISLRAFVFTQLVVGRHVMREIGLKPCSEYYAFSADGEVVEKGYVGSEPYYSAALTIATPEVIGGDVFTTFAMTAPEMIALNAALNAGNKVEDIMAGPFHFFLEVETEEGSRKANKIIEARMREMSANKKRKEKDASAADEEWWETIISFFKN